MKVRRITGGFVSAALSVGLIAGCSEKDPTPIQPNQTLEQVEHNLGYTKTLGKLTLSQHFSVPLPNHEVAEFYDFTPAKLNVKKIAAVLNYYAARENTIPTPTRSIQVNPLKGKSQQITTNEYHAAATEHDFVLVPWDTSLPKIFTKYDEFAEADAETEHFDTVHQAISVIKQPTDEYYQPTDFLQKGGIYTEMCQSMVTVEPQTSFAGDTDDSNYFLATRLAQETICNGLGEAFAESAMGTAYDLYQEEAQMGLDEGTVEVTGIGNFLIHAYTVSTAEYAAMGRITK